MMDFSATHRLGPKAFTIFMFRHAKWPLLGVAIAIMAWYWTRGLSDEYLVYGDYAGKVFILFALAILIFKMFRAYFEYRGYAYRFDKQFFHVTRGYVMRQEIGVVYHHIQTVSLRHGILDRVLGVCDITIIMTSSDATRPAEVILPSIEKRKARLVQEELLRKARYHSLAAAGVEKGEDDEEG